LNWDPKPSNMKVELLELWRQLLAVLPRKLWHSFSTTDVFYHNIQLATSLTAFEYETLLINSGITFKKRNVTMFSMAQLDHLQEGLKDSFTIYINRSKIERNGNALFFIAVDKPNFCSPKDQRKKIAKGDTTIQANQNGKVLDDNSTRFLQCLCDERVTEEELVEIAKEDQPLVLVTPTNTNSLVSNKRNCIGIDNSRIERYKKNDMKYCLSNWSYLNGWRSHSCTFLFRPAAEKDTRCKHCFSAYTNINKERHPNLFMDEELTKNVKSHSEICEAVNLLRSCLTRLFTGKLPLGAQPTTDTNMFQVIKALNSLNMTSPIQLSNGTKIIFCSSFHDVLSVLFAVHSHITKL